MRGLHTRNNAFGHVAISINGKVYSFGSNYQEHPNKHVKDWGASKEDYLTRTASKGENQGRSQNDLRETAIIELNVSPEQERQLQAYLEANNPNAPGAPEYNELTNSCVTVTENALIDTGILPEFTVTPILTGDAAAYNNFAPNAVVTPNFGNTTPGQLEIAVERAGLVADETVVGTEAVPRGEAVENTFGVAIRRVFEAIFGSKNEEE